MFFTPELLSRRDSGFGLLWLAATLGAKSSFKKLPRRSVVTADIVELCNLIAEPPEPLALRLSSNLMIGAARVYKVKQEIFLADVTTCFHTLKKAVQDMHTAVEAADLQMAQGSVRADMVTISVDPSTAFAIEFEHLFSAWGDKANQSGVNDLELDEEFDPKSSKRRKAKATPVSQLGHARGDLHTLNENHEHLLSLSFDTSFNESGFGVMGPSSSQAGFGFDDNFLDGLDVENDIGDELARELGAGWGGSPEQLTNDIEKDTNPFDMAIDSVEEPPPTIDFHANFGIDADLVQGEFPGVPGSARGSVVTESMSDLKGWPPGSIILSLSPANPEIIQDEGNNDANTVSKPKNLKRVRLLLDARTELTNEELQSARTLYMESQAHIRREIVEKQAEKKGEMLLEEMILGVPRGLHAPVLIDFWLENFRLQVQARSGQLYLDTEGEPPKKRRKVGNEDVAGDRHNIHAAETVFERLPVETGMDLRSVHDCNQNIPDEFHMELDSRLRSSEEPGQARQASRPPSAMGSHVHFYTQPAQLSESQRSALFPWDNAGGVSSSAAEAPFEAPRMSDRFSASAGHGRRGSSLDSKRESLTHLVPSSPLGIGLRDAQIDEDLFEFDVPEGIVNSQNAETNPLALERQAYNFLEYCKMQINAFPSDTASLTFDNIVPLTTSTPHVAAAAFYNCLVLATKDLVQVEQENAFGNLRITVK